MVEVFGSLACTSSYQVHGLLVPAVTGNSWSPRGCSEFCGTLTTAWPHREAVSLEVGQAEGSLGDDGVPDAIQEVIPLIKVFLQLWVGETGPHGYNQLPPSRQSPPTA